MSNELDKAKLEDEIACYMEDYLIMVDEKNNPVQRVAQNMDSKIAIGFAQACVDLENSQRLSNDLKALTEVLREQLVQMKITNNHLDAIEALL